jgi:hypothetical protein
VLALIQNWRKVEASVAMLLQNVSMQAADKASIAATADVLRNETSLLRDNLALGMQEMERLRGNLRATSEASDAMVNRAEGLQRTLDAKAAALSAVEAASDALPTYAERSAFQAAAAKRLILERPVAYTLFHLQGVVHFVLDPGRFDLQVFFALPPPEGPGLMARYNVEGWRGVLAGLAALPPVQTVVLLVLLLWNVLVAVAFVAWVGWGDAPLPVRLGALALVAYVALVTGPVGAARYRMPVYPLLLLALPWAWAWLRSRRAPAALTPALA